MENHSLRSLQRGKVCSNVLLTVARDLTQSLLGKSSSGKMRSLVALTLLVAVASGDMSMMKKIHHDMMTMSSQAMCWGKGNTMYYKLAMMKAMEECEGGHSSTKPANPFSQLNKNPFQVRKYFKIKFLFRVSFP